jgi:hypothetical protein
LRQVELHIANFNTSIFGIVEDLVVEMGIVEESFRWNAANIQTCTAECTAFLNAGDLL